jgi:DNA invertase Pin-like site-specific DNA recombinase
MKKAIPYYRVSTERQGHSGLGLEAQQKSVRDYAACHHLELVFEFTEIESGKKNKRPGLLQAIEACKQHKATLLIAKLDRLSRNVAFISKLMESGVDFVAVDNPNANKLMVHIMAAFAEYERDQISQRTKAALAAAKERGVKLGVNGKEILSQKNKDAAKLFASNMKPVIENLYQQGITTIREITERLNTDQIKTYQGDNCRWHKNTVHTLIKRINSLNP